MLKNEFVHERAHKKNFRGLRWLPHKAGLNSILRLLYRIVGVSKEVLPVSDIGVVIVSKRFLPVSDIRVIRVSKTDFASV